LSNCTRLFAYRLIKGILGACSFSFLII